MITSSVIAYLALATLMALCAADIYSTKVLLKLGGYERNRLIAWLFEKFGLNHTMNAKAVLTALFGYLLLPSPMTLVALCALMTGVVINNIVVIRRLKAKQ